MNQKHLLDFIKSKEINAELITFEESVKDSKSSAVASNLDINKVVKTVVFKDKSGKIFCGILRGSERVCKSKVKEIFGCRKLSLIKFEDVEKYVGFPAGGVPPFGFSAGFVIDSDLKDDEEVLVGGGTIYSLFKINVKDIKMLCEPITKDIKQNVTTN